MEDDGQQISAWNHDEYHFVNRKNVQKNKKKLTQIDDSYQKPNRKIKPSHTLPVIRNLKPTINQEITQIKSQTQDSQINHLIKRLQEKIIKVQKANQIQDYIKKNSQLLLQQQRSTQNVRYFPIPRFSQDCSVIKRRTRNLKISTTVIKENQLSNFEQLKIKANQYSSSSKQISHEEKERNKQLLLKMNKNSEISLIKKSKSRYYIVKKQKISPQKTADEISKIVIESKRLNQQDQKVIGQQDWQKKSKLSKQRSKNIRKNIDEERKNFSGLLNSKSQQFTRFNIQRAKTEVKLNDSDFKKGISKKLSTNHLNEKIYRISKSKTKVNDTVSAQDAYIKKSKQGVKLNKITQQPEKMSINQMIGKQKSLKMLRIAKKNSRFQPIDQGTSKKAENLTLLLANRNRYTPFDSSIKIQDIKDNLKEKMIQEEYIQSKFKKDVKLSNQYSLGFNEFSDEFLFKFS